MFIDNYNIHFVLEDENGRHYTENYLNISLSDFEIIYGNTTNTIISLTINIS